MANRITNDVDVYRAFVWQGLSVQDYGSFSNCKWLYIELSQFLDYGFSCSLQHAGAEDWHRLHVTRLVANREGEKLVKGLFPLGPRCFQRYHHRVSRAESRALMIADVDKFSILKPEGILLDGVKCELMIEERQVNLIWNADYQMNNELSRFVMKTREICSRIVKNNAANTGYTPTPPNRQARTA